MRHKTFLINPEIIYDKGIPIHKCIQKPGEFVITFGGSYHAGFNMGLNCAEAVNFATKNWINLGIKANVCKCRKDSVNINMYEFIKNIYEKKLLKKKEFEEFMKQFYDYIDNNNNKSLGNNINNSINHGNNLLNNSNSDLSYLSNNITNNISFNANDYYNDNRNFTSEEINKYFNSKIYDLNYLNNNNRARKNLIKIPNDKYVSSSERGIISNNNSNEMKIIEKNINENTSKKKANRKITVKKENENKKAVKIIKNIKEKTKAKKSKKDSNESLFKLNDRNNKRKINRAKKNTINNRKKRVRKY